MSSQLIGAIVAIGIALVIAVVVGSRQRLPAEEPDPNERVTDFTLTANNGEVYDLAQHRGQVLLIVNTASRCGFTKQYDGLQDLHERYQDQGLVVIGVPSNDFMGQEPGNNEEIAEFCRLNFGVTFPLMAKVHVKGDEKIPLYQYLTERSHLPGKISWNFNKFLVGRDGHVQQRFGSRTKPAEMSEAIAAALAEDAPKNSSDDE